MKKLAIFTCILALCVAICLSIFNVSAHSGRTDSSGGHYDKSTGKYHYHHGYSAHQHYDMDGDGDIDCPYNFSDKTNHSNSSNSSNISGSKDKTNNNSSISQSNTEKSRNKITFGNVVETILLMIPLSLLTLCFFSLPSLFISMIIGWIAEKCFKVSIKESNQQRIFYILWIIGTIIIVLLEFLFLLGIL